LTAADTVLAVGVSEDSSEARREEVAEVEWYHTVELAPAMRAVPV
jgi:hypothetical protein